MIKYFCDDCELEYKEEELTTKRINNKTIQLCANCLKNQDKIIAFEKSVSSQIFHESSSFFNRNKMFNLCHKVHNKFKKIPIIYCSEQFAQQMVASIIDPYYLSNNNNNEDCRESGYIGSFRGCDVIVVPSSQIKDPSKACLIPIDKEEYKKIITQTGTDIVIPSTEIGGIYYIASIE